MNNAPQYRPPRLFTRLLKAFCHEAFYEELQGDLEERFFQCCERESVARAKRAYAFEVIQLFRPSVFKKVKTQNNNIVMFKNYSLIAWRTMARNKLFSAINIVGLAVSMAVGLLAITFITEVHSYDDFHENGDRIYRVTSTLYQGTEKPYDYASISPLAGKRLKEEFTGYEAAVTIYRGFVGDFKKGDNTVALTGLWADKGFFSVFKSFSLLQGDPQTALEAPNSILLTSTTAMRLFGRTDVLGEIVEWNNGAPLTVTGICADPPRKSHLQFEALGSFSTLTANIQDNPYLMLWQNMWNGHVYVLAPKQNNTDFLQKSLDQLASEENEKTGDFRAELVLQPLNSIMPGKHMNNEPGARMKTQTLTSIATLALIVLLSACFNYTNLSIARVLKRSKEVGVRKVIGAKRSQLLVQFILEAAIIAILALLVAIFLFFWLRPEFLLLDQDIQRYVTLEIAPITLVYFFIFALIIGMLAGLIPSWILSRQNTTKALKGSSGLRKGKGSLLRKTLVGLQFTVSLGFAILVTLSYEQYQFVLNYDLGFKTDNILNVELQGNDREKTIAHHSQLPEVVEVSSSSWMPSIGGMWRARGKYIEGNDSTNLYNLHVSPEYIENLGHELLAGTTFIGTRTDQQTIVNEQVLKRFGIEDPADAIGQHIDMHGKRRTIVGVVKDFHYATLDNTVGPFMFMSEPEWFQLVNLKINSTNLLGTMDKLEQHWAALDPIHPLKSSFYDDRIARAYSETSATMKTLGLLAIVAITISLLGLLGMAIFTTQARIKEITIRKVLGANFSQMARTLSSPFVIMFLLSTGIAVPGSYFFFKNLIIDKMKYSIDIGFVELGAGALAVLLLALLTIGSQTLRAVGANPIDHLRDE